MGSVTLTNKLNGKPTLTNVVFYSVSGSLFTLFSGSSHIAPTQPFIKGLL